jgi:DNA-binding transcriptional ArsR family regulator
VKKEKQLFDWNQSKKSALIFRALNNKLRQKILNLIAEEKSINVTDIYVNLRIEQSVASQHLGILRTAGFVITKREGKTISYAINYPRFQLVGLASTQINSLI